MGGGQDVLKGKILKKLILVLTIALFYNTHIVGGWEPSCPLCSMTGIFIYCYLCNSGVYKNAVRTISNGLKYYCVQYHSLCIHVRLSNYLVQ